MENLDFRSPPVIAAANRLPEALKLVLTLRDYEEVSAGDAAEILGLTEGDLKKLHVNALEQLRALLEASA